MNKINLLFVTVVTIFLLYSQSFGQPGFLDSFDSYIADQQLVCQNPTDWTTWSLTPCDSVEDPYISTNHSFSGTKSVVITEYNDLIKPLEAITSGKWYINFQVYIPNGKAGYFNTMSGFKPNPLQWAMEVYFDASGSGRLESVPGAPISFTWLENTWQMVEMFIDLDLDWAEFWFNGYLIHSWEWTQGGLVNLQLDANDFFGWYYPYDEMYIDNYLFIDVCPLCYILPSAPSNLTAQLILNPDPQVQLNWTDNSGEEYTFNIIRKVGSPNDPGEFELIGTVLFDVTQFIDSNVMIDSTYTYGILAYNHNGYSDTSNTATIIVKPVPVELTSFTASVSGNDAHLKWSTATELNNSGFEIHRFTANKDEWEIIGFLPGYGTTTEPHKYSFTDKSVSTGIYQYRLKQIDYDGSFEYSDIVEMEVGLPTEFALTQNYPNPFNPTTSIQYAVSGRQFVSLKVYDVLGNEIATLVNEEKPAGSYEVEFSVGQNSILSLSSGIYFYQLKAGSFIQTKKMILLR